MDFTPYPRFGDARRLSKNSSISNSNRSDYSVADSVSSSSTVISVNEDKLYIAVDKKFDEGKSVLSWALQNSGGRKICLLHVHQPAQEAQEFSMMGGGAASTAVLVKEQAEGRKKMLQLLDKYLLICSKAGVQAEKLHIETKLLIEEEIVKLISQYEIRWLVMGAASMKQYSRNMTGLKSKKAKYVNAEAPATCHIWFVCKDQLIYEREGRLEVTNVDSVPEVQQSVLNPETIRPDSVIVQSVTLGPSTQTNPISSSHNHYSRAMSINLHGRIVSENYSTGDGRGASTSNSARHSEASLEEDSGTSMIHLSQDSHLSYLSAEGTRGSQDEIETHFSLPVTEDDVNQVSPHSILARRSKRTEELKQRRELEAVLLRERLEHKQAMAEVMACLHDIASKLKREAFEESTRREKAEQEAVDATHRARASESAYAEELKHRKELEAALLTERLEHEKIQNQRDKDHLDELQRAHDQRLHSERQSAKSVQMFSKYKKERDELQIERDDARQIISKYKKEIDELQIERDNALQIAEDLKRKQSKSSSPIFSHSFSEFSFLEIEEATRSFDPFFKIVEGDYGTIYKGFLRHTEVAIKMLHPERLQAPSEYQREVDVLSKLQHPNIVTLIGACPDLYTLIYEYLPNRSLEDRLNYKDISPLLSWKTRIRIATELCSALVFLHTSKPHSIVHGDLKPANILLDANFVSKLSNFGACRVILPGHMESIEATTCYKPDPQGNVYMDPEISSSGETTAKSDVYSFGVVLLRLLTGKQDVGIPDKVHNALENGELKSLLDCDWPYAQAQHLAHLALKCVMIGKNRPDLGSEVLRVLQDMQASCGVSSSPV